MQYIPEKDKKNLHTSAIQIIFIWGDTYIVINLELKMLLGIVYCGIFMMSLANSLKYLLH